MDVTDADALGPAAAAFDSLTALSLARDETVLVSSATGGVGAALHLADANAQTLTALAGKAASGALRVPVTATYPLEQAAAAFAAGTLGKIAVTCS